MFCETCGQPLGDSGRFCPACGTTRPSAAGSPAAPAPPGSVGAAVTEAPAHPNEPVRVVEYAHCPNPECPQYSRRTVVTRCPGCGRATVPMSLAESAPPSQTVGDPSPVAGARIPALMAALGQPGRRRYGNGRRVFYAGLWGVYTVALVCGFFGGVAQANAGAALLCLVLAAVTGSYAWRIWTYRARHLWLLIFF